MLRKIFVYLSFAFVCACGGGGGGGPAASAPATGSTTALAISGTPVTLTWEGEDYLFQPVASSQASGGLVYSIDNRPPWASFDQATGRLYGKPAAADVGVYSGIRISVSDGSSQAQLMPFALMVDPVSHGAVTLTWSPPSQNTDDSPLNDLEGFNIYWGGDPADLSATAAVVGPGLTSFMVENLEPGKYFFAMSAVNVSGIESALSDFEIILVR